MTGIEECLVLKYTPLVRRLAAQMVSKLPASVDQDDLVQAGMIGLLDAVRRYRQSPDAQFETYAVSRIRGAMVDELRSQDWLPRSVRVKARQIEHAIARLDQKLLRPATEAEIAEELEMSLAQYHELLEASRGVQIFHYEDMTTRYVDVDADLRGAGRGVPAPNSSEDPLSQLMSKNLREALIQAIKSLPKQELQLFSLLFEQDLTQKEIAAVMGVSEGRVSQVRSQAIARIRAALAQGQYIEGLGEIEVDALL